MFEYGVPAEHHLELPEDLDLELQFPLAIGTLGDFAAETVAGTNRQDEVTGGTAPEHVTFAAQVLVAVDASRHTPQLSEMLRLLAACAFYLADAPGSASALLRSLTPASFPTEDVFARAIRHVLSSPWIELEEKLPHALAQALLDTVRTHFVEGGDLEPVARASRVLRKSVYASGSPHELLLADIVGAVSITRVRRSAWSLLPEYSLLPNDTWRSYLKRPESVKELWPAQRLLGVAGLYRGESSVVQMPTSAGKTRAIELILRSAFVSGRTRLAVVVAPFRALCHEIANDFMGAFATDGWVVNRLSDALQQDYKEELSSFLDVPESSPPHVVVLTPEKFLYVLRQEPKFVENVGLVVYDEGHQFDTGTRGVTYELLLTSVKRELPNDAQSVLVSAVIKNSADVAQWLLGDEKKVVADQWLKTRRLVAFASHPRGRFGQLQFSPAADGEQGFFVPRVIVPEKLDTKKREKPRVFPSGESSSLALYLGLRLVPNGGVAIYVRMPASAAKLVRDSALEVFPRNPSFEPPASYSDSSELKKLVHLFAKNFGEESYLCRAAKLGIFGHHGSTPHGIRLTLEHAMRESHIRFIVCTSTLAQGVNLPIRYLLITTPMQGRDGIKPRDFHNLIGRAGRAGMYGEGTIVFTDVTLFDKKASEPRRWNAAQALLKPDSAEATGSTLLHLFKEISNDQNSRILTNPAPADIVRGLVAEPDAIFTALEVLSPALIQRGYSVEGVRRQLDGKKSTIEAVESFLMAYRAGVEIGSFTDFASELATETLAYAIAPDDQKALLAEVFELIAEKIERDVPDPQDQARYGRTLFGVDKSLRIDAWVKENRWELELSSSVNDLLETAWPFLLALSTDRALQNIQPDGTALRLAKSWVAGTSYEKLLSALESTGAYIPQKTRKRKVDVDLLVGFCEQTLGYEFPLYLAAVRAAFVNEVGEGKQEDVVGYFDLLQKKLKYGLPTQDTISYYEVGFAERVVAQELAAAVLLGTASSTGEARRLVRRYAEDVRPVLQSFPAYFSAVFERLTAV